MHVFLPNNLPTKPIAIAKNIAIWIISYDVLSKRLNEFWSMPITARSTHIALTVVKNALDINISIHTYMYIYYIYPT